MRLNDDDSKPLWADLEDETFFLGAVPLEKFKKLIEESKKGEQYLSFDTSSPGYCTDAVLKVWRDVYLARIKKNSKYKTSLKKVDLRCCSLVTDSGLGWLAEIVKFSPDLFSIQIDGCTKVTDFGLSALKVAAKSVQVSAMATSVTHLNLGSLTKGCPLLIEAKSQQTEDYLQAHILIVPHDKLDYSFSEYILTKSLVQRESLHHVNSWEVQNWNIAVTEISHSNPLFESLVPKNPTQVLIPFDASADLNDIKSHITKTITRIISKETVNPPHKDLDIKAVSSDFFLDTLMFEKCMWSHEGVFTSLSVSERVIGCHVSRQPMSRTNCYFEIECVSRDGTEDVAVLMGIVHDVLFSDRHPMMSNEKCGGAVDGMQFQVGDVIGFGIEGVWESEYVPMDNCSFYFTKNGSKCLDKTLKEKPHCGMYPIISVLGKNIGEIRLKNYAPPPEKLLKQWESEKQYIEPGFSHCMLCDEDGVLTYSGTYKTLGDVGLFVSRHAITKGHNSCTIQIVDTGELGTISLGVGPEDYKTKNQPGWLHPSVAFHGDDGKIFHNESGTYKTVEGSSSWKKGDEIMAVVSGFNDDMVGHHEQITVTFYKNGKKVKEKSLLYKKPAGIRCVFLIGMHSANEKVKILNFRRPYQPDPPADNMLTMGRSNFLKVYDNGTLTYCKFDSRQQFGLFISKTPISKTLSYFEMKVHKTSEQKHIAIGLCHRDYKINEMPGWLAGSVGYHADNGQLYNNGALGMKTLEKDFEEIAYGDGDVVGCGIEAEFLGNKLKPQQTIKVYFTKNGTRVHDYEMEYITDGLFPCAGLHFECDRIQLMNFFPGCQRVGHETPTKTKHETKASTYSEGCNFHLVAVGDGTSDAAGKAELVKQQLDLEKDLDLVADLENEVDRLERNLGSLRVQGQQYYSKLCRQLQCLKQIITAPERLRFMSVDTKTGQGHEDLVKLIVQTQETNREFYPMMYELHTTVKKNLETIVSVVRSRGVIPISELQEATGGIFGESCHLYSRAVKFLHKKGQLVYLPSRISHLALDTEFVKKRLLIGVGTAPNEQVGKRVPCVGETTPIWTKDIISELLKEKGKNMQTVLVYLGVMRLPCIRTKPDDPMCLFTTLDKLQPTEAKLSDFWANGKELENTVVMSRCYKFPIGLPPSLLSATMTLCSMFSRPILLCPEGGVFQSGAVQTVIVKHHIEKGEAVTIESKCYSPEIDNTVITEDTAFHIEEYTWQVYCIFSDIIDFYIANQGLITIMHENAPHWFANISIGCSHDWSLSDVDHPQTVCTMCNLCCDKGIDCEWSGIMGQYLRECHCGTRVSGCKQCGICKRCADELWQIRSFLRPCTEVSRPSKTGKHGALPLNGVTSNEVECINLDIPCLPICLQKQNDSSGAVIQVFPGPAVHISALQDIDEYNMKNKTNEPKLRFEQGDSIKIRLTEIPRTKHMVAEVEEEDELLEIMPIYHTLFCREVRIWHGTGILCYDSPSSFVPVGQFCAARPLSPECNKFSLEIISPGKLRTIAIGLCHRRYLSNRQPGWDSSSIAYHADDGGLFVGSGWPLHTVGEVKVGDKMTCELNVTKQKVTFYHNDVQVYESNKLRVPAGGFYPIIGMHSQGEAIRLLEKEPWLPPKEGDMPVPPLAFDAKTYGNLCISPGRTLFLLKRKKSDLQGWLLLYNPSKDLIGFMMTGSTDNRVMTEWSPTGYLAPHKSHCLFITLAEAPNIVDIVWFNLESGKDYTEEEIRVFHSNLTSERLHSHSLRVNITVKQLESVKPLRLVAHEEPEEKDVYMLEIVKNGSLVEKYWLRGGAYHCLIPVVKPEDSSKDIFLRYPKAATFDQPNMFQKGMRLVAQPYQNVYAECMIVAVSRDGQILTLEYSPKDSDENITMDLDVDSEVIQLKEVPLEAFEDVKEKMERLKAQGKAVDKKDLKQLEDGSGDASMAGNAEVGKVDEPEIMKEFKNVVDDVPPLEEEDEEVNEDIGMSNFSTWGHLSRRKSRKEREIEEKKMKADIEVLGYETRGNFAIEKRGYIFPPMHILSESARFAIIALDSNWKENSLISQSKCDNVPTRVTVQEQQIMAMSRDLPSWVRGSGKEGKIDQAFAFLPKHLNKSNLCHPSVTDMFEQVDVHRLCFLVDQVYFALELEQFLDIPIHFVNMPPITPRRPLSASLMYGNIFSGWTYTSLIATKLQLPVCDKVFPGGQPDFSREQLEVLMHQLVQVYAAQCHIIAEEYGSLQLQQVYNSGTSEINSAIAHNDVNVKTSVDMENSSYLLKRRFRNHCLCKTHLWTLEKTNISDGESAVDLTMNCFLPYEETVNCFARDLYLTESLPSELFTKFSNLQYFSLDLCENMRELPTGISSCKRLNTVSLSNMALTVLPSDIFKTPQLENLICANLLVKSLPTDMPESSKLTRLTLSGMQLELLPPEICKLHELIVLDLSYNPLKMLPMELGDLQKLRVLSICGMPWISMDHNKTITYDIYTDWFNDRPYIQNFLSKQKIKKMFSDSDVSKNGMLDVEEVAGLNLMLLWEIPRIGAKHLNDEEYGGIPPAIFLLTSLEELYLDYQAIVAVPVHMCRLLNLRILSLTHNPLLESLPGSLGHLPNIKSIDLLSCPSLRTPPNEVVSRGFESVKAYLKRLAGGFTECRRTKLMFVGLGGAGKTSLLKALLSAQKKTEGTKGEDITDGIVIQPWTIKNRDGVEVTYNTWDFAGQTLYYNTHQFFLSKRAIYLLLWSTRQGFEHAGLDFWLSSVACHAPHTPIFVVGTHCDQVPKADIPQDQLMERYPQIVGFHFVSSVEGKGIAELEEKMLEVTLAQKNMGEKIPQVWLSLEQKILKARTSTSILKWESVKEYGMDVGIYDEKDIREAIQFLHELGTVQYFDNDFLRDHVVINPQWIVNVMSCVVSVKNSPIQDKKGRFEHDDIPKVWSSYPPALHKWLLRLTEEFDLTFPIPREPVNIVPCLLPHEVPKDLHWPSVEGCEGIRETKIVYRFAYLPAGLFNRAQVRLFQFSDGTLIWKWGSLLKKNKHLALIEQVGDSELIVKVQGPRPENVIFLVHEIFESLIEESFHGVVYHFLVPCPDCILKEGTLEPSLFESKLISHAKDCKAPFIQCRKYFHTISMGQLQDLVPDVSDFDTQLHSRIIALQQLNDDRSTDVAIVYTAMDVPKSGQTGDLVNPMWIKDDLEKEKFSVWFCEDMGNISAADLLWGIKNAKVVVALVSDNFERDEKCCNMLWYAMDSVKKNYVIAVIGESMAWENTDMGMRIGKQEVMAMIKTKSRYNAKVKELLDMVRTKWIGIQLLENKDHPPCFISYCWSNSKDAVDKGTKHKDGSLGWGDPRAIKKYLQDNGVSTWIDHEQTNCGGAGLFQRIAQAIRHAKVFVACVSDEYLESENCMMELRFGVLTVGLPLILCIVGTKTEWKDSEIGILAQRSKAPEVFFQEKNSEGFETVEKFVKTAIPKRTTMLAKKENTKQDISEIKKKQSCKNTNVSFQEEYELTQRKFMRHIISFISTSDTKPMPRLIVLDFDVKTDICLRQQSYVPRESYRSSSFGRSNLSNMSPSTKHDIGRQSLNLSIGSPSMKHDLSNSRMMNVKQALSVSRTVAYEDISEDAVDSPVPVRGIRPKTSTRSRDRMEPFIMDEEVETWEVENFCIKVLCEHEEGWHECKKSYPFRKADDFFDTLRKLAPYLFRVYSILKQSPVQLNCLTGERADMYQDWIDKESQNTDFLESFQIMRDLVADDDSASDFLHQLCRCHLPSGKIFWLCEEHQAGPRITKLSLDVGSGKSHRRVVFPEDTALKQVMEKSDIYRKRKAEKSKPQPQLPPPNNASVISSMPSPNVKQLSKSELLRRPSAFERADAGTNFKPQPSKTQPSDNLPGKFEKTAAQPATGSGDMVHHKTVAFSTPGSNPSDATRKNTGSDSNPSTSILKQPAVSSDSSDSPPSRPVPQKQIVSKSTGGITPRSNTNQSFRKAGTVADIVTSPKASKTCAIQ